MNIQQQHTVFAVAYGIFDLQQRLENILYMLSDEDRAVASATLRRRATELQDLIPRLAAQSDSDSFRRHATETVDSLGDFQVELYGFLRNGTVPTCEWNNSEILRRGLSADWGGSEWQQYSMIIRQTATRLLSAVIARFSELEHHLPDELQPFFVFCKMTFPIPAELDEWSVCDPLERERRRVNELAPQLISLLERCYCLQPLLINMRVGFLNVDELDRDLAILRNTVLKRLSDGLQQSSLLPTDTRSEPHSSIVPRDDVDQMAFRRTNDNPEGLETPASNDSLEALTPCQLTGIDACSSNESSANDDHGTPERLQDDDGLRFRETDSGVAIDGVEIEIATASVPLLTLLWNAKEPMSYGELLAALSEARSRSEVLKKQKKVSQVNVRTMMSMVGEALSKAFPLEGERLIRREMKRRKAYFSFNRDLLKPPESDTSDA